MRRPTAAPVEVVTFGETMALVTTMEVGPLRHARTLSISIGGTESNVATALRRLGIRTAWCGRVGDDEFGRLVVERLRGEDIDVAAATVDPEGWTGLMIKERRTASTVRVTYFRKGSAASRITPNHLDRDLIGSARILHVTGITPALSGSAAETVHFAIATARDAGVTVSFDVNYRSRLWSPREAGATLREFVPLCDVLFATEAEARLLSEGDSADELIDALLRAGAREVVIMRGREGAVAVADDERVRHPARTVPQVDPVGAGDAFVGGYLAGLLEGLTVSDRLRQASDLGAFAVTVQGDWEGLPDPDELRAFVASFGAPADDVSR